MTGIDTETDSKDSIYDIIIVSGEVFFDHPLSGPAILKRLLEKHGYSVGIIEQPRDQDSIKRLGKPRLAFAVSSGSIDSMVRNYTPLKKRRDEDPNLRYTEFVPDRAVIVYCNWLRQSFKGVPLIIGGTEATLRRFTHYDYWDNKLRRSILFDSRADLLIYGSAEKQLLEAVLRLKSGLSLDGIDGTCVIQKICPQNVVMLPSHEDVEKSKESFCRMQNLLTNKLTLCQKAGDRYVLQYKSPIYTSKDLDEYYGLDFSREVPKELAGFQFSIVTHRGCIGDCNFCSLRLMSGDKIISRSEASIIREAKKLVKHPQFKGNIDDLGGPSANMYGMDCELSATCSMTCIKCARLKKSHSSLIDLMKELRSISGIRNVFVRSGIRYDLCTPAYIREIARHHVYEKLQIAPEHTDETVLKAMNKDGGHLDRFIKEFEKTAAECRSGKELSYYFMTAHPGSRMKEAENLAKDMKRLKNVERVQVFTPTPMTVSTCMYYTSIDPRNMKPIYVPYTYSEKKAQKRLAMSASGQKDDEADTADNADSFEDYIKNKRRSNISSQHNRFDRKPNAGLAHSKGPSHKAESKNKSKRRRY